MFGTHESAIRDHGELDVRIGLIGRLDLEEVPRVGSKWYFGQEELPLWHHHRHGRDPQCEALSRLKEDFIAHPRVVPSESFFLLLHLLHIALQLQTPNVRRGSFVARKIGSVDIEPGKDVRGGSEPDDDPVSDKQVERPRGKYGKIGVVPSDL